MADRVWIVDGTAHFVQLCGRCLTELRPGVGGAPLEVPVEDDKPLCARCMARAMGVTITPGVTTIDFQPREWSAETCGCAACAAAVDRWYAAHGDVQPGSWGRPPDDARLN